MLFVGGHYKKTKMRGVGLTCQSFLHVSRSSDVDVLPPIGIFCGAIPMILKYVQLSRTDTIVWIVEKAATVIAQGISAPFP